MIQDNFLNGAASRQTIGESIRMTRPGLLINRFVDKIKIKLDFIQALSIDT
jgi:hypothetical protein